MALKESTPGAPNAARWQGSCAGGRQGLPVAETAPWEEASHTHLQLQAFLTFLELVFVFGWIPCPGLTQRSHQAFWMVGPIHRTLARPLVFSRVIQVCGSYPMTSPLLSSSASPSFHSSSD